MKILVCGGRDYDDVHRVFAILNEYPRIDEIIHGAANGADFLARCYAKARGVPEKRFPADWQTHGRSAGMLRNRQMLDEGVPDLVVAFPGGRGTADMIAQSRSRGFTVREVTL